MSSFAPGQSDLFSAAVRAFRRASNSCAPQASLPSVTCTCFHPHMRYWQHGLTSRLLPSCSNPAPRPDWWQPGCWAVQFPPSRSKLNTVAAPLTKKPGPSGALPSPTEKLGWMLLCPQLPGSMLRGACCNLARLGQPNPSAADAGFIQALSLIVPTNLHGMGLEYSPAPGWKFWTNQVGLAKMSRVSCPQTATEWHPHSYPHSQCTPKQPQTCWERGAGVDVTSPSSLFWKTPNVVSLCSICTGTEIKH